MTAVDSSVYSPLSDQRQIYQQIALQDDNVPAQQSFALSSLNWEPFVLAPVPMIGIAIALWVFDRLGKRNPSK